MKVVEIGAVVVAAPLIEAACKKGFAYMICEFAIRISIRKITASLQWQVNLYHHYSNLKSSSNQRNIDR